MEIQESNSLINEPKSISFVNGLQILVLVLLLLYFGKTLFIPLSFALLISFILYPICKWLEQKGMNKIVAILVAILGVTVVFGLIILLLYSQVMEFTTEWGGFKAKVIETYNALNIYLINTFGIDQGIQLDVFKNYIDISNFEAIPLIRTVVISLSESFFAGIMILVFSALILYYRHLLTSVLYHLFPSKTKNISYEILIETIHAYYNFVKGMAVVYLIVGILNSIGLLILGIPHPFLFGFIASILTFIPYFGIMIASLLPITVSWIEFNSIYYPLGVIVVFSIVQILEAYVIFPMAVGNRLKINALAIIVTIVIGGILWGAAGMILFIPFVSFVKLIADRSPNYKAISILLGEDT